ncbi:MAG: serine/threonine protein phosphatase [Alkalibacterium sp.]|nr:serine/threonine protein phosphatase [Alkalibacterium sp.]
MKKKVFVVGDVHSQYEMFKEILNNWNEQEQQLILLGDLGDRGENPRACFELARTLVEDKGAVCLKGNHEDMFLNFLDHPQTAASLYEMNGGMVTIQSFLDMKEGNYGVVELSASIQSKFPWLKPFIESLPLKYEWEDYVFVHAGVNLTTSNWRETSDRDYVWIREGFYDQPNHTDKTFVFGHTVTAMLHNKQTNTDIWDSGDGKIGLDGGAVYGGTLHGVVFDSKGIIEHYKVKNKGYGIKQLFGKD